MSKSTSPYPQLSASATGSGVVSHAGAVLLLRTAEKTGLAAALTTELARFRKPLARHDPGKILLDLAVSLAVGGDCLADIAQLRAHPEVFGQVASDPTVSRLIGVLAADADTALAAIGRARATARTLAWTAAGESAPDHAIVEANPLVLDIDATLVTAHSEKEQAAPTFKRGFGFHPLCAFVDHGAGGTGEPVAMLLRPGNSGSNTAADHVTVVQDALAQSSLPASARWSAHLRHLAWQSHHRNSRTDIHMTTSKTELLDFAVEWAPRGDGDEHVPPTFGSTSPRADPRGRRSTAVIRWSAVEFRGNVRESEARIVYMTTLSVADARAQLSRLVDAAERTHERFEITRNGHRAAVLLGVDDYDALRETIAVLSDTDLLTAHLTGRDEVASGEVVDAQGLPRMMRDARSSRG